MTEPFANPAPDSTNSEATSLITPGTLEEKLSTLPDAPGVRKSKRHRLAYAEGYMDHLPVKRTAKFWIVISVVFSGALYGGISGRAKPYTPKPGSAERKAILDALRKPVERAAKQQVVFHQVSLRVEKGWAFVNAISMDKSGKKLVLGDLATSGLLRKDRSRWRVLHWGVAGDISVTCEAAKRYPQAPRSIFGATLSAC